MENYLGIEIDYNRDKTLPEKGLTMLTKKGFYKKSHETSPQQSFARAATCYCFGDYGLAQRIYDAVSKGWFMYASPVLSNANEVHWPTFSATQFNEASDWLVNNVIATALPISCYLQFIPDTKEGLVNSASEVRWLSMMGGGVGIYTSNRSPDDKSTGVMAHLRGYDADTLAYKQQESRRGSIAAYLDITHPEIKSFLSMRNPVGGDPNKKLFNLNNAVNLSDSFMESVINGTEYELVDPKHGKTGKTMSARDVWEEIIDMRFETGEPYIHWVDTVNSRLPKRITNPNYKVTQSNLCVAPETLVLTDKGQIPIAELENKTVNVWNGFEWSPTTVYMTSPMESVVTVWCDDGAMLECTPFHKWYVIVRDGSHKIRGYKEKRTYELIQGDELIKSNSFDTVAHGNIVLKNAYESGFYTGDGTERGRTISKNGEISIYKSSSKIGLIGMFTGATSKTETKDAFVFRYKHGTLLPKYEVPDSSYNLSSRLEWLAGLLDADGCILSKGESFVINTANIFFANKVKLLLQELGVDSTCGLYSNSSTTAFSAKTSNEYIECSRNPLYVVRVHAKGVSKLLSIGLTCKRLKLCVSNKTRATTSKFVKITGVDNRGRETPVFCFSEPKRHMGVFNGILTGQCSEIELMTDASRTAVCCLSSLNLEKYEEWKDTTLVQDLIRFLDNVLEYFIRLAPKDKMARAIYSAKMERALGLGTFGWHSFLQSKNIPFESGGVNSAASWTHRLYSNILEKAESESKKMAIERGESPDCTGSGFRNSHLLAVAPNASSSEILGSSPSIEPYAGNAFNSQGRAGSFLIKNKYLEKHLDSIGYNTDEVWLSIIENDGSVQHLSFLDDHTKKVFKIAYEIDPMWVVELAAIRQDYICQSQSVNLFVPNDITKEEMSDIHMMAWKKKLKTLYYCRTKAAVKANIGTGGEMPLNAIPIRQKIEYDETVCRSCEG